jgi:DNA-binding MarR family transcriptional regulator
MPKKETRRTRSRLDRQVEQLHYQLVELIKKYQFRDRNRVSLHGISVTQCYILETLQRFGKQTMTELADRMRLSVSTITRVIEPLVEKKYLSRERNAQDGRSRLIRLTPEGKRLATVLWDDVLRSEREILAGVSPETRESLINLLAELNRAVTDWQAQCRPK